MPTIIVNDLRRFCKKVIKCNVRFGSIEVITVAGFLSYPSLFYPEVGTKKHNEES